jgi:hypothetical protein
MATLAAVLTEGRVLMYNGLRCLLRIHSEDIGAVSGQVTDISLPRRFADRILPVCGRLLASSLTLLLVRVATGTLA